MGGLLCATFSARFMPRLVCKVTLSRLVSYILGDLMVLYFIVAYCHFMGTWHYAHGIFMSLNIYKQVQNGTVTM